MEQKTPPLSSPSLSPLCCEERRLRLRPGRRSVRRGARLQPATGTPAMPRAQPASQRRYHSTPMLGRSPQEEEDTLGRARREQSPVA